MSARRAVVFGASGGVGGAFARQLAREGWDVHAGGRSELGYAAEGIEPFHFDYANEASIARAAEEIGREPLDLVFVATGILHGEGFGPEKAWSMIDGAAMAQVLAVNTIGPALVAKHFLGLLHRERRSVFAALGARVGSIGDNRLGGWHSYRASKAALVMLVKDFAIELARRNPQAIAVTLHPGTVATALSAPFQGNVADDKLFTPEFSAERLRMVIDGLTQEDSGRHFAWDGALIPD
ncbi:SDR family NAD(P)-dependent oxidoreductase [Novosphingobium aquimarinum]|uniref:SDR family NAD(P)-dependent oxidoreductase n=1 Tax=Novosphingobium aquimarinum TaxID=2682494 RepID=UPI0012EB5D25|nr:SDR family NAD(P)-dependent oxidoreductase [Novosphingobium aquimarinum]